MKWYVIPLFVIMLVLSIYSAASITSAGLPVVLEFKNHTMASGLHNLTVVVSNNFTCANQIVANQTFIGGIVNGRSNITLRNLNVDYNTQYYVCNYLDGTQVGGSPMNTTLGQGYIQLRDLNVSGLNNAIAPVWGNVSSKPVDLINSTFANNTYIFKVNESFLNVNSSVWWTNLSGFQYRWFIASNFQLAINETTLNSTIDTRVDLKLSPVQTNMTEINNTINTRIDTKLSPIQTNMTEINNTLNTRVTTLEGRPISNVSASGVATKLALFNNATHLIASDISEDSTQVNFTKNVYIRNNLTVNGTFIANIDATNITSGTLALARLPNLNNTHFLSVVNITGFSNNFVVTNGLLHIVNATATQKIDVFRNNTFVGSSENLNFIAGQNITINVTYDSGLGQNNVTFSGFGGGGGAADGVGGNATAGGNVNYLAKFTNSTNLGNSLFYEDGKNMNLTGGNLSLSENIRFRTNGNGILDSNGKWMMKFNQYDVSVNYFNLYNSPGSDAVQIGVQGDGANVDLQLSPLGVGSVDVGSRLKMQNSDSTNSTNFITSAAQTAQINYTLPAAQGSANTVLLNNGSGILSWLLFSNNFNFVSGRVFSVNATSKQNIDVFHNNSFKGTSEVLNFINGGNITLSIVYDSELEQNNVTISSFGGGGGGAADGVGGNATAAGTANYIAKFTNQTNLGNSVAYDNGSNIGVGLITPNEKLTLNGSLSFLDSDYAPAATSGFGKLYSTVGGVDSLTMLNLHFDGSDGSTTFSDSSSYNKLMVANGNVQIDTAQSKFGGASGLFDGTGDYLKSTDVPTDFDFGSGNFTVDVWVYLNEAMGIAQRVIVGRGGGFDGWNNNDGHHWVLFTHTDSNLYFSWYTGAGTGSIISASAVSLNSSWHHIAVVKNGTMTTLYIDGGSVGNATVGTISEPTGGTQALTIGSTPAGNSAWNGWIDELRISKGVIRWGGNFTVPSSAYSVPGLNYIDNAGTTTSITGTVPVTRGGTGLTTIPANRLLWSSASNIFTTISLGSTLVNASGTILSVVNNSNIQKVNVLNNGAAVGTRSSINFIPGNQVSLTISDNSGSDRVDVTINSTATSSGDATAVNKSNYVYGIASNLKITNANPDDYTKFLLHFNGVESSQTILESSRSMRTITTSGNVKINATTAKFGQSGYFDGTGDYLTTPDFADLDIPTNSNWTLDLWINATSTATSQYMIEASCGSAANRWLLVLDDDNAFGAGANKIVFGYFNTALLIAGIGNVTAGSWTHLAITRNSTNNWTMYINGVSVANASYSTAITPSNDLCIGAYDHGAGYLYTGFMDEVRISKGSLRWASDFSPPNAEYYGYPQYKLNISADVINLYDGENATTIKNMAVLPDVNVTGVNGLDAGIEANSVWYYAWVINNGTTTAGLLSTSSTSPTMPAGYSFKKLVSAVYNNAGGNFSGFQHVDDQYIYSAPIKVIDSAGGTTTASIDLSATVPEQSLTKGVHGKFFTAAAANFFWSPIWFSDTMAIDNNVVPYSIVTAGASYSYLWELPVIVEEQTMYYQSNNQVADLWVSGFTTRS